MPLFEAKVTPEHKAYLKDCIQQGMTNDQLLPALVQKFGLPANFISKGTISHHAARARTELGLGNAKNKQSQNFKRAQNFKKKKGKKTLTEDVITVSSIDEVGEHPHETVEILGSDDEPEVKDLAKILSQYITKKPSVVRLIANNWKKQPADRDAWDLLEIMQLNEIGAVVQRQVIMDYFGLEAVREIWKDKGSSTLKPKRVTDAGQIDDIITERMKNISQKIKMKDLEDTWKSLQQQDDPNDPLRNMQKRLEYSALLKQLESTDTNNAVNMFREFRAMIKEDNASQGQQPDFLDQLLKYKQLIGNDGQTSKYDILIQQQLQATQEQIKELKNEHSKVREDLVAKELELIKYGYGKQMEEIKNHYYTADQLEEIEARKLKWAREHGMITKDEAQMKDTREAHIEYRVNKLSEIVEKIPEKLAEGGDKLVTRLTDAMENYANLLERRELATRRQEMIRPNTYQAPTTSASLPINNAPVTQQLAQIEQSLDTRKKWHALKEMADQI